MEMSLAFPADVNTSMSDKIKVVEYPALYINFWQHEKVGKY